MNDLITTSGNAELAALEPEKRLEVIGIIQAENDIENSIIRLGGHLCRLKAMCQHGEFEALAEKYCRMGKVQRSGAMKVFREYGEKFTQVNFSGTVLKLLAYAPDPQAALEEANSRKEAGEAVTAKIAREIAAAQKAQQKAEQAQQAAEERAAAVQLQLDQALEAAKPNQDRLIRELRLKRKGGGISEAEANALSLLPEDLQRVQYERLRRGEVLELDKQAAERTAAQAVENQQQALAAAQQARAEAEEAKRRANELAREGAQAMIDDLTAQIEALNKQVERVRETSWEEGKSAGLKSAAEAQQAAEAELRQQIATLEKEKAAVQRQLTSAEGRVSAMAQETRVLEARARGAEEQLESAHPLAKDNIHAGVISHMTEDLRATLAKLEADCEPHQRKFSEQALQKMAAVLDQYLVKNSFFEGEVIG